MEETSKKFKLDNNVFKDFDSLMTKHLDTVEELTVSFIENNSKIFNIISLFTNIKTLIIEGDARLNVSSVLISICKPYLLENLILEGVKLPNKTSMKKLINLKMISLNNIGYCDIKAFFDSIEKPDKIRAITLNSICLYKNSINILKVFKELEIINLIKIENGCLRDLEFLLENRNLRRVNIENNTIEFKDAAILLKGAYKKNIVLSLPSVNTISNIENTLEVDENGEIKLTIDVADLGECTKQIDLAQIDKLLLIIDQKIEFEKYIDDLKKVKKNISIAIKDVSFLDKLQAEYLKESLKIKYINILDFDGVLHYDKDKNCYLIDRYIKIRECIDELIQKVSSHSLEIEKFLEMYKILSEHISYDEFLEDNIENYNDTNESKASNLENGLIEKHCINAGFAEILKNCLACLNIESNIITGTLVKSDDEINWNQVKIENNWYNVDIALDSKTLINKNILKKKAPYCLVNDKEFYQTHKRKYGKVNYCMYTVNRKAINGFFRTGIFSTKVTKVYLYNAINSLKRMFSINKRKALPKGENDEEN